MPPITTISRMSSMISNESEVSGPLYRNHKASRHPASVAKAADITFDRVRYTTVR